MNNKYRDCVGLERRLAAGKHERVEALGVDLQHVDVLERVHRQDRVDRRDLGLDP